MTIKDIAKLSGYGIGTVSRVLNNHSDVSDKGKKKDNGSYRRKQLSAKYKCKTLEKAVGIISFYYS